jgi:hypothetical protein
MNEIDYKKEYNRICQEVAKMLVDNRRNHETPMTPFELLSEWDKIREVKNCSIPDVVGQSEQLHTEVFNLANKLAINGYGNEAVKMHRICNGMYKHHKLI